MAISRRQFLTGGALGFLALGLPPSFLLRAAESRSSRRGKVLVVIFQRGGMDGLNAVIPFREKSYYALRPSIAISEPASGEERSLDLDGFYALHPALAPLKPLFDAGVLAIVHAAGSPDNTRSHFDAQDYMEMGTPGVKSTPDGWLNRYLLESPDKAQPLRAVAASYSRPRILAGKAPALTVASIEEFRLRDPYAAHPVERLYSHSADPLFQQTSRSLWASMAQLRSITSRMPSADTDYPQGRFSQALQEISRLIKSDVGLEIAFSEIEGWDTHAQEGGATGAMALRLGEFAQGLGAFYRDLGDRVQDVVIITLSEFGRTVRENGNRGTDHGHANVMFALGGKLRGGKVYGRWPGLEAEQLYEGRDLALTTDFRAICAEVLSRHLGLQNLARVFPGFKSPAPILEWQT